MILTIPPSTNQPLTNYAHALSRYPKATGGTPITSWLINQIEACLQYQTEIQNSLGEMVSAFTTKGGEDKAVAPAGPGPVFESSREDLVAAFNDLSSTLEKKKGLLAKQVQHLNESSDYNITLIYSWNKELGLNDDPSLNESKE
jgi:hypothetical protein